MCYHVISVILFGYPVGFLKLDAHSFLLNKRWMFNIVMNIIFCELLPSSQSLHEQKFHSPFSPHWSHLFKLYGTHFLFLHKFCFWLPLFIARHCDQFFKTDLTGLSNLFGRVLLKLYGTCFLFLHKLVMQSSKSESERFCNC